MKIFSFKGFDCRSAICGYYDGISALFQQADGEYLIHGVIFRQQYPEGRFLFVKGVAGDQGNVWCLWPGTEHLTYRV